MTELETLKDIPSSPNEDDYTDHSSYYRDISLKQAAIKWIKELEIKSQDVPDFGNPYSDFCCTEGGYHEVINFIKYLFNITDKDLKCNIQ